MAKILVCDGNDEIREYLRKGVSAAGFNPVLARDQEEALSILNFSPLIGALLGAVEGSPAEVVAFGRKLKEERGETFPVVVVGGKDLQPAQIIQRDSVDAALPAPKPKALVAEVKRYFEAVRQQHDAERADAGLAVIEAPANGGGAPAAPPADNAGRAKGIKGVAAGSRVIQEKDAPAARRHERTRKPEKPAVEAPPKREAPPPEPGEPLPTEADVAEAKRAAAEEAAKAAQEMGVPREGSLLEFRPGGLLFRCFLDKLTGKLSFTHDTKVKHAYFKEGKLAHLESNEPSESVAGVLHTQGKLSGDQMKDVTTLASAAGGVVGALFQLGLVQPQDIMDLMKESAARIVSDVFAWGGGRFTFMRDEKPPAAAAPMSFDVVGLVRQGVEGYDADKIEAMIGDALEGRAAKNLTAMEHVDALGLKPAEFRITRMVNGLATGNDIVAEWAGDDAEKRARALQIMFLLTETGMIELQERRDVRKVSAEQVEARKNAEQQAQKDKAEELNHRIKGLKGKNYYEILGVDRGADLGTCKKAYIRMAREHHPDTLPEDAIPALRDAQERFFSIISEANDVLSDESKRDEYLAELRAQDAVGDVQVDKVLEAEVAFQKGEVLIQKKDFQGALEQLELAVEYNPDEGEHYILLGWAMYCADHRTMADAMNMIKKGLKMRKDVSQGWVYLGHMLKAKQDIDKAEKYYKMALQVDPKNGEAMSELRLIEKRKGKKGGLFG